MRNASCPCFPAIAPALTLQAAVAAALAAPASPRPSGAFSPLYTTRHRPARPSPPSPAVPQRPRPGGAAHLPAGDLLGAHGGGATGWSRTETSEPPALWPSPESTSLKYFTLTSSLQLHCMSVCLLTPQSAGLPRNLLKPVTQVRDLPTAPIKLTPLLRTPQSPVDMGLHPSA